MDATPYLEQQKWIRGLFGNLAGDYPLQIIDPATILCRDSQCLIADDGRSLYTDDQHLSVFLSSALSI